MKKAYFEFESRSGYIIDEEKIRRIFKIITNEFDDTKNPYESTITFYLSDKQKVITDNLEDLISEENNKWQRIMSIEIKFDTEYLATPYYSISLSFSDAQYYRRMPNIEFKIEATDRKFSSCLGSDVANYLKKDVVFNPIFQVIPYNYTPFNSLGSIIIVTSSSIITYLILTELLTKVFSYFGFKILSVITPQTIVFSTLCVHLSLFLLSYFFPRAIFMFGKEKSKHESLKILRDKVLWGIAVALVVGIVAGIITNYFSPS